MKASATATTIPGQANSWRLGYWDAYEGTNARKFATCRRNYWRGHSLGSKDRAKGEPPRVYRHLRTQEDPNWQSRTWGAYVRDLLWRTGISRRQLAIWVGVDSSYITLWAKGRIPHRDLAEKAARVLEGPVTLLAAGYLPDINAMSNPHEIAYLIQQVRDLPNQAPTRAKRKETA